MRRLGIAAVGLALMVLMTGCMWGIVRDTTTGAPISGAKVSYTDSQGSSATATTGANGVYAFDFASGPIPAVGPASFVVSARGYETLATTRQLAYDDNASGSLANPSSLWEVQDFSLAATYSCLTTLMAPAGPVRAARGIDRVPTGPDAVNVARCVFASPATEITVRLLLHGETVFEQRIVLASPSSELSFPLPDELVGLVPADLEPGAYERQIEVMTVEGKTFDVVLSESTVWVD
jgi:hypothetical protein